jgi:hypothetical protein
VRFQKLTQGALALALDLRQIRTDELLGEALRLIETDQTFCAILARHKFDPESFYRSQDGVDRWRALGTMENPPDDLTVNMSPSSTRPV